MHVEENIKMNHKEKGWGRSWINIRESIRVF
jgi:hypothetical protein